MLTLSLEWEVGLKPRIKPYNFDLSFAMSWPGNNGADGPIGRPSKRQQGDTSYLSPAASGSRAGDTDLEESVRYLYSVENIDDS